MTVVETDAAAACDAKSEHYLEQRKHDAFITQKQRARRKRRRKKKMRLKLGKAKLAAIRGKLEASCSHTRSRRSSNCA